MSESQISNNKPLIIAIIAVVALLICCCLVVVGLVLAGILALPWSDLADARVEATESLEKSFEVSTPASLLLDINVGDIIIQADDGDEVRIQATKHAWGRDSQQAEGYLDDFRVEIQQPTTGEVEIKTEIPARLRRIGRTPKVDLKITVPYKTDLKAVVNVGELEVTGVEGAFDIESNVGDVTLRNVRFVDDSQITSQVGDIELRLPAEVAFTFRAESNVGDIRVDFPIQNERSERKVVGGSVQGEIGTSPTAYVELEANTGNINIRRE